MPPCQAKHTLFTLVCHYRSNNCLTDLTQNAKSPQKNLANIYLTHTCFCNATRSRLKKTPVYDTIGILGAVLRPPLEI